ncbi:hypothetical protein IJ670_06585 [bacterium]|nr:hypothetical protein [bacterium]
MLNASISQYGDSFQSSKKMSSNVFENLSKQNKGHTSVFELVEKFAKK